MTTPGPVSAPVVLVLEAGGTTLRAALFDGRAEVLIGLRLGTTPCGASTYRSHDDTLREIAQLGAAVLAGADPDVVVLAYPGPVDREGRVLSAPTILRRTDASPFPLLSACSAIWPTATVHVLNDLTAAGYRFVASGLQDFAVVTIGSGIGHKVFENGRPLLGPGARGGEIGHLRLDWSPDAQRCDCGGLGHLGGLASGRGTVRSVKRRAAAEGERFRASALGRGASRPDEIDSTSIASAYLSGDEFTVTAVGEAARFLGQGLAAIHLGSGVEHFVLLGGFATALGEAYRRQVAHACAAASWDVGQNWDHMVNLGPPDDACALLGAGMWTRSLVSRSGLRTPDAALQSTYV